ncbi:MAG: zinc-binding dehydrogenase [Myxococcales bacterium]|nr:zinc-binding dehydrogenase [Myxococcales bacterium]
MLRLVEEEDPAPNQGEVRIAVRAIGVNYADCLVRMGVYSSAKHYVGWPITPGFEVAGVVDAVGEGVDAWQVGDEVIGVTRFGGYASRLVVSQEQVFRKPKRLSFEEAAALPAVMMTAWYGLFGLGAPRKGQRMLVHSGAGGVGSSLVQLGKIAGCEVIAVVGAPHKIEVARKLGADDVISYQTQELWPTLEHRYPDGFHLIFDANGADSLRKSYQHLAAPGRLILYGFHTMLPRQGGRPQWWRLLWTFLRTPRFQPLEMTQLNRSVLALNLSYLFEEKDLMREGMMQILGWLEEEKLVAPPIQSFPLEEAAKAHQALESAQTVGKLVLVP